MGSAHIWDDRERLVTKKSFAGRVWDAIKPVCVDWCEGAEQATGPQRQPGKSQDEIATEKGREGKGRGGPPT